MSLLLAVRKTERFYCFLRDGHPNEIGQALSGSAYLVAGFARFLRQVGIDE